MSVSVSVCVCVCSGVQCKSVGLFVCGCVCLCACVCVSVCVYVCVCVFVCVGVGWGQTKGESSLRRYLNTQSVERGSAAPADEVTTTGSHWRGWLSRRVREVNRSQRLEYSGCLGGFEERTDLAFRPEALELQSPRSPARIWLCADATRMQMYVFFFFPSGQWLARAWHPSC